MLTRHNNKKKHNNVRLQRKFQIDVVEVDLVQVAPIEYVHDCIASLILSWKLVEA